MPPDLVLDPAATAVVTLDLQSGVVSMYAKEAGFTSRVAAVLKTAREAAIPVIHVRVAFRTGVPEASDRNVFLSAVKRSAPHQRFFQGETGALHPGIAAGDGDLIVTKSRVSAFADTDLGLLLRAAERNTLVIFGIATSGAVLSTVLHAADLDYRVIVVRDCCADLDASLHDTLVTKVFPRQGVVITADQFSPGAH
jgi:nicotinamidase-related amidase